MSTAPIPNTGVSVITDRKWSLSLFFQLLNGHIEKATHLDGVWNVGPDGQLAATPIDGSPLASITYSAGKEIRVYYLDTNYVVQEYCYSHGKGWFPGEIGQMNAKAVPGSGLAATVYGSDVLGHGEAGVHIRVYYQQEGSNALKELANDGYWHQGDMEVNDSIGGTSVSAVAYYFQDQTQIRVYYQSRNLSIKEHGHNNSGWFDGAFNPGQAGNRTPISAIVFGNVQLQVYWRNLDGKVVYAKNTGSWGGAIPIQIIGPGFNFAVLQWDEGRYIRMYYQLSDSVLVEFCSDDGGNTWFQGEFHSKGN